MLASLLSSLTSSRDAEKERYRKLLSHVCDKVCVVALRNTISSPNRFRSVMAEEQGEEEDEENINGEQHEQHQQSDESNEQHQQQQERQFSLIIAAEGTSTRTTRRQRTNSLIRQRLQTRIREQDEQEYDIIDPEEVAREEEARRRREDSGDGDGDGEEERDRAGEIGTNARQQNQGTIDEDHHLPQTGNSHNQEATPIRRQTVNSTTPNVDSDLDPELLARRFEVIGYLVYVDNKNITLLDICPPDSKNFSKNASTLLPEHRELIRSTPLCSTIKIESIVSIAVAKDSTMMMSGENESGEQTSLVPSSSVIAAQRKASFERMMKTDLSGDVLCQALILRFVWERICVENPVSPRRRQITIKSGNNSTLNQRRRDTQHLESRHSDPTFVSTAPDQETELHESRHNNRHHSSSSAQINSSNNNNNNNNNNNRTQNQQQNSNRSRHRQSSRDDDDDESTQNSTATTNTEDEEDIFEGEDTDDDEENDSGLDLDSDDEEIANWLGIREELETSQRERRIRERRRIRRRMQAARSNSDELVGMPSTSQTRNGLDSLQRPHSRQSTAAIISNHRNLADCAVMNRVRAGDSNHQVQATASSSPSSITTTPASPNNNNNNNEPNFTLIISPHFMSLQQFVGELLVVMKLADFDTEAEATFRVLEHAGRKTNSDFGFQSCIAQARHLRQLNEHVLEGRTAGSSGGGGSVLWSLFGRGSSVVTNTNFFDLDDDDMLREMLRNRFRRRNGDEDDGDEEEGLRRVRAAQRFAESPWATRFRVRVGIWCFLCLVFLALAAVIMWKAIYNFSATDEAPSRFLVDLSVLLLMPGASSAILSVGIFQSVAAVFLGSARNLPVFDKFKLLRFLVTLSAIISVITIGLKWRSSQEPDGFDGVINTIASRTNSSMCDFQVKYNCSGASEYCDPQSFWFGNATTSCPAGCDYESTIFASTGGNMSLWWSPTQSCAQFVADVVQDELVFLVSIIAALFFMNILWGLMEATCFAVFNGGS